MKKIKDFFLPQNSSNFEGFLGVRKCWQIGDLTQQKTKLTNTECLCIQKHLVFESFFFACYAFPKILRIFTARKIYRFFDGIQNVKNMVNFNYMYLGSNPNLCIFIMDFKVFRFIGYRMEYLD